MKLPGIFKAFMLAQSAGVPSHSITETALSGPLPLLRWSFVKRSCRRLADCFIIECGSQSPMPITLWDSHSSIKRPRILLYLQKAMHFLTALRESRCRGFNEYCWGYPFDWVWHGGTIKAQTPLITTTPYVYEAFLQVNEVQPQDEFRRILASIARHVSNDIKDFQTSTTASSCSYTPFSEGGVLNAAAYRAFLLASASRVLSKDEYWRIAERNLNFVCENQNPDGSWPYAVDGVRGFVDHFHTCFVMKALAKIYALTGYKPCGDALAKGVKYYLNNLFAADGLPKPFSKAPRLTVYKRELYDCAECINLCLLLRDEFPQLETTLQVVIRGILNEWVKPDGSFRSRRLYWGWDNVPMHRWGQSQMFRSLAYYLNETKKTEELKPETLKGNQVGAATVRA